MDRTRLNDLIQSDLDGALTAAERAELARLLLKDPDARHLRDQYGRLDRLLRDIPQAEPPSSLRAAILGGTPLSSHRSSPRRAQRAWPLYGMAAAVRGLLLIVGIGYFLRDGHAPGTDLRGSPIAAGEPEAIAPQDHWSIRAESVEVKAWLRRDGPGATLEIKLSTAIPCEVIARFDPATTTLVGDPADLNLTAVSGQITIHSTAGSQAYLLDFSRAAPVELQLRCGGRLLAEGKLSVSAP